MSFSDVDVKERYTGNGSNTDFAIPFDFTNNTEIKVYTRDESTTPPTEELQVLTTDYTLVGGTPVTTVRFNTAPVADLIVVVIRVNPFTQSASYAAAGPFPNATHEEGLDKLTRLVQEVKEMVLRAPRLQLTSGETGLEVPDLGDDITEHAGEVWILNPTGTALMWGPDVSDLEALMAALIAAEAAAAASAAAASSSAAAAAASAVSAAASAAAAATYAGTIYRDSFTGDGVEVNFTLSVTVTDEVATFVFIDGVYQPKSEYSISGTTLTFGVAPDNLAVIEVMTYQTFDVATVQAIADAAAASAAAAATAETNAETAETNAETAETNAEAAQAAAEAAAASVAYLAIADFTIANNVTDQNVTTMLFDGAVYRTLWVNYQVYRNTTAAGATERVQSGTLILNYLTVADTWVLTEADRLGEAGVEFSVVAATGQVTYTSDNQTGTADESELKAFAKYIGV